jgi:hypothetical protein
MDLGEGLSWEMVNVDNSRPGMVQKRGGLTAINRAPAGGIPRCIICLESPSGVRWFVVWDTTGTVTANRMTAPEW